MSGLPADEDVIACWGESQQHPLRMLVAPAGIWVVWEKGIFIFFPRTGELRRALAVTARGGVCCCAVGKWV